MSTLCGNLNPLVTNGLSYPYHLDESIFIYGGIRSIFSFLFHFSMKFMSASRIALNGTPRLAAAHLELFCLPMSHKKKARLIWVKLQRFSGLHYCRAIFRSIFKLARLINHSLIPATNNERVQTVDSSDQ